MEHSFNVEIAEKYGMLEAVILNNLHFWITKNAANEVNFYDGDYWTYNSIKAFERLFTYVTGRKIRNALKHLEEEGLIKTGNYNKSAYDRTLWYAITKKGFSILQKRKMENSKTSNQNTENVKPIPDNKPYSKPDKKPYIKDSVYVHVAKYLNEKLGTSYRPKSSYFRRLIDARINEGATLEDFQTVIDKKYDEWVGTDMEKYLRPQTLFGTKFESYLNSTVRRKTGNDFLDLFVQEDNV